MQSYVVFCSSPFRDAVQALAQRRSVTVSDLVLGITTIFQPSDIARFPDPGDAPPGDREEVQLKSGLRQGRLLKRKPRLQLRLRPGLSPAFIRQALALLLAIESGDLLLNLHPRIASDPSLASSPAPPSPDPALSRELDDTRLSLADARTRAEEMRALVGLLAFDIPPGGITSTAEARYVLGFPPQAPLTRQQVKARFRLLSQIYHPDKPTGDNTRMTVLIDAARYLDTRLALGQR